MLSLKLFAVVALAAATPIKWVADLPALTQDTVDAVNSNKNSTWVASLHHKFEKMTVQEAKQMMGTWTDKLDPNKPVLPVKTFADKDKKSVPQDFDSRTNWASCASVIGHVRDQASCGSCWAFGSTEAFNDRTCIASGGSFTTLLSPQDTAFCCDSCGMGCNGGYPEAAWQYFQETGTVTGGDYGDTTTCSPYSLPPCEHHVSGSRPACQEGGSSPQCSQKCQSSYTKKSFNQDTHNAKSAYSLSSVSDIQQDIMANGPVTAAFTVYNDFLAYKSGVYTHQSGQMLGGHAIKILGWGVESGSKYWLVANSWNTDWGNKGYFKIARGTDECGIEDGVCAGDVTSTLSVAPSLMK